MTNQLSTDVLPKKRVAKSAISENDKEIAREIKEMLSSAIALRIKELNLSYRQVAQLCNVTSNRVCYVCTKHFNSVSIPSMIAFAKGLDIKVEMKITKNGIDTTLNNWADVAKNET